MAMASTEVLSGPATDALGDRPSASIVILAWNQWPMTDACLRTLRPTLGIYDEVIVVDNGSVDETRESLGLYPWVKVVRNPRNRGFAGGNNDGAAIATRDVVVFLNNDTLLAGRWLDQLLVPFLDPAVGATGPRSNFVSGPQIVTEIDYARHGEVGLRRFVARWEREQPVAVQPLHRLVGFCLAVRRETLEQVGGFDESFGIGGYEDDDLCRRVHAANWDLLMANRSFVHHHGHATFDGNGLDWRAIEEQNRLIFEAKHGTPTGPSPVPSVPSSVVTVQPRLEPGVAVVVDDRDGVIARALNDQGWTVLAMAAGVDLVAELDRREPRPSLVVVRGPDTAVDRLDVPVIAVGCDVPGADASGPAELSGERWLPEVLTQLATTHSFGGLMLRCREALDANELPIAIEAVRLADELRPGTAQALNAMAVCAYVAGDPEQSLAFVRRALTVDPTFQPALDNLAALSPERKS